MQSLKRTAAALVLALLLLGGAGGAMASTFVPAALTTLTEAGAHVTLNSLIGQSGYVTPLAFDSARTLELRETWWDNTSAPLFSNQELASVFGQSKNVANLGYLGIADATDRTSGIPVMGAEVFSNISQNYFVGLTKTPWTLLANGLSVTLPVGAIIVFHDEFATWDKDYNDFVFALSQTAPTVAPLAAPTPVPGAVWLLGSGLLGLAGFRRARRRRG